jgi:CheY-like chemotaxis protein
VIRLEQHIDTVLLDVNLGGKTTFYFADQLIERGIPFVFTTGYDASAIPSRFGHVARCEKPIDMANLVGTIGRTVNG